MWHLPLTKLGAGQSPKQKGRGSSSGWGQKSIKRFTCHLYRKMSLTSVQRSSCFQRLFCPNKMHRYLLFRSQGRFEMGEKRQLFWFRLSVDFEKCSSRIKYPWLFWSLTFLLVSQTLAPKILLAKIHVYVLTASILCNFPVLANSTNNTCLFVQSHRGCSWDYKLPPDK